MWPISLISIVTRNLHLGLNYLLGYRHVYILSAHCLSNPDQISSQRIFGVYLSSEAARVAMTEVLRLPEYEGRRVKMGFPELNATEPGIAVALHEEEWDEDAQVVVLVEKMVVRKTGL